MADKVSPMQDDIARPPSPRNDTFDDENINEKTGVGRETSPKTSRHCGLQARHITMIAIGGAIGGAIGTGLISTQERL